MRQIIAIVMTEWLHPISIISAIKLEIQTQINKIRGIGDVRDVFRI
jgi:hypothetical protein